MTNGWKVTAIIFMILFILETLAFVGTIFLGVNMINKENECSYNICQGYEAFIYDDYSNVCSCYKQGEVVKQEYLK